MTNTDKTERRLAPRYDDRIQIDLLLSENNTLPVEICSISQRGLQFVCDSWLADEIEPHGIQRLATSKRSIGIQTMLPFDQCGSRELRIDCLINAVRRLSQDSYLIGLEFTTFHDDSETVLFDYIEQLKVEQTE